MYYEINISRLTKSKALPYEHYFATAERSITTMEKLKRVYNDFKIVFPEPMFKITVTYKQHIGHCIDIKSLIEPV
jgi:hypothetical protein